MNAKKRTMTSIKTESLRKKLLAHGIDAIPFFTRGMWVFTHQNHHYVIDDTKDFHFVKKD